MLLLKYLSVWTKVQEGDQMKGIIKQEGVEIVNVFHQKSEKDPTIQWDTAVVIQGINSYNINIDKAAVPKFKRHAQGVLVAMASETDNYGRTKLKAIDFIETK